MPENPRLSSLGMNGILSKLRQVEPGGAESFFRHSLTWPTVMTGMPADLKPRALARGVGSFPTVPLFEVFLGISEVIGHVQIFRDNKIVEMKEKEGKDYYMVVR